MSLQTFVSSLVLLLVTAMAPAAQVFNQPPNPAGGLLQSSWWDPDDSDYDILSWDDFTLSAPHAITEVQWRGGFLYGGSWSGPVINFTVEIYSSIAGGSQPDVTAPPLVSYETGGNAGQTPAGTFGGTAMYDYHFVLPSPFQAAAGTRYWLSVVAWHHGIPEWGCCSGTGGDGHYFRFVRGAHQYQAPSGDAAFALISSDAATFTITGSAAPANAGAVQGAGAYPENSLASLVAVPNAGWAFSNWTVNGTLVSTSNPYTFTVTADRTLTANFVGTYIITTAAQPSYGGTISGAGIYNSGSTVTLIATPHHGFEFTGWSDGGTTATHSFPATADVTLTAFFVSSPLSATFNFDTAPAYTTLPTDLTVGGLSAHFSAYSSSGGTFAIWPYDTWGIKPVGFSGLSLFPTTIYRTDLIADFSQTLVDFSILYSPQELGCDDSATMRATAYLDGVMVGTATMTATNPGTYPSATLSLVVPTGFNRVVVHYDSPPPTCQDWGPIYFADNVTVTRTAVCPSDFDGDGFVTGDDFDAYVAAFELGVPAADFDRDGFVTGDDFDAFVFAFEAGC